MTFISGKPPRKTGEQKRISKIARRKPSRLTQQEKANVEYEVYRAGPSFSREPRRS